MIRAWGQFSGHESWWIRNELATAHEDKAPGNAIYKRTDGTWATIEDIKGVQRITVDRMATALQRRENPRHPDMPPRTILDADA